MKSDRLYKAIREAKRFLEAAEVCEKMSDSRTPYIYGGRETGAAKRASMDLTRALAQLRKGDFDE